MSNAPDVASSPRIASLLRSGKQVLRSACPIELLNWREARFYAKYGEVELHFVDLLCHRHRDAIDVGANDGSYVHFLRRHSRAVVAFEPVPDLVTALRSKFARCNVLVFPVALSAQAGATELRVPVVHGAMVTGCSTISSDAFVAYEAHVKMSVPVKRLDDVYEGDAGFIKIDVEGHEQAVLDGAIGTIRRCRPRMLVEIDERLSPGGLERAKTFFAALGYRGHYIYQARLLPIEEFRPDRLQHPDNLPNLVGSLKQRKRFGDYVYNFIFLPSEDEDEMSGKLRKRLARFARYRNSSRNPT
jgi:FkbM family methyltransferase